MTAYDITSREALEGLVWNLGFLPFFQNSIPGFSVEERTPPSLWFSDQEDGPWEWKGPVIRRIGCAYGKFFQNKAAFISRTWFPDFANWRRDGYDFDARYDDGLAKSADKYVFDLLDGQESLLSKELKRLGGFGKKGRKGYDAIITRLQMQGYVTTTDFEYQLDKNGMAYGWGVARYATPERYFGAAFTDTVYSREPEESKARILAHLAAKLPDVPEREILKWMGE